MGSTTFYERLQKISDRPDLITGLPLVEILGNQRVLIEQHRGITEYTTTRIDVRVAKGTIRISGSKLELMKMTGAQLIITGLLDKVELGFGGG